MVGRLPQLQVLAGHLDAVRAGSGRTVFITGEAGVGKTRLASEFLLRVRSETGVRVLKGRCHDADRPSPYGPFVEALRSYFREQDAEAVTRITGPWARELSTLLPELAAMAPSGRSQADPQGEMRRLSEAVHRVVRPQEEDCCRILLLEDLHWADSASLDVLSYLAHAVEGDPLLLLATYRSDELRRHDPLLRLTAQLSRERLYHEVPVPPLTRDELTVMLEATLQRRVSDRIAYTLHDRTGGNPFFSEELLRSILDRGDLDTMLERMQPGKHVKRPALPDPLKRIILSRVLDLNEAELAVLRYAAVIGRHFDFELLRRVTGLNEEELLRCVRVLVDRQLVVEEDLTGSEEDRYMFRHALTREAVYGDQLGRERRVRHREIVRAMEDLYDGAELESHADGLAYHCLRAGEPITASRYARLAAERAASMYAYRDAVGHYEMALELLDTEEPRERATILERLGELSVPLGETDLYTRYWEEARRLYERAGDRHKVGDLLVRLAEASWERGDNEAAFDSLAEALEVLESEPPGRELAMVCTGFAAFHMLSSQYRDSVEWGEKALRLADDLAAEDLKVGALRYVGWSLMEVGKAHSGLERLETGLELAKRLGPPREIIWAYSSLGEMLAELGQVGRASALLRECIKFAGEFGWELHMRWLLTTLAAVELELGHWDDAVDMLDTAIRAGDVGVPVARLFAAPHKGELLLRQGRLEDARELLQDVRPACEKRSDFQQLRVLLPALARVRLALGDAGGSVEAMDRGVELWKQFRPAVTAQHLLARGVEVYLRTAREPQAKELLEALSCVVDQVATPLARARLEHGLGLYASYEGRHSDAGDHFRGAARLWTELRLPYDEALSRRHLAENLLEADAPRAREEAAHELTGAWEIFSGLGARLEIRAVAAARNRYKLPARPTPRSGRNNGLTPREKQVIALLAEGHSNRMIAEELVITEKTAEVHVGNILGKLGFSSRAQAAAHAVREGLADAGRGP